MELLELLIPIVALIVVLLLPAILALMAFRQFRRMSRDVGWRRVALLTAILANWLLLILFLAGGFGTRHLSTRLADILLVSALLLAIGSAAPSVGKWKLVTATFLLLSFWIWTEQHLASRDNGSMLSVLITSIADRIGFPDTDPFSVLHKMANYEKRGHYDAAIRAGKAWTEKHPNSGFSDNVFIAMASLCLQKAQRDRAHSDDYVKQALLYRDKALPMASDPALEGYSSLRDLALISEYAGDLSPEQRCVQFGNAVKLYENLIVRLKDKQDEISRRFVLEKNDISSSDVDCWRTNTQEEIERMRTKQHSSGCK
jgi:hypothetical protein